MTLSKADPGTWLGQTAQPRHTAGTDGALPEMAHRSRLRPLLTAPGVRMMGVDTLPQINAKQVTVAAVDLSVGQFGPTKPSTLLAISNRMCRTREKPPQHSDTPNGVLYWACGRARSGDIQECH